jgi:hypothetical protein
MGAVSEILLASLGGGSAGAVLANSVSVWLRTRVTQVKVRIEGSQGSVEVEAGNVRDPAALITRILEERNPEEPPREPALVAARAVAVTGRLYSVIRWRVFGYSVARSVSPWRMRSCISVPCI